MGLLELSSIKSMVLVAAREMLPLNISLLLCLVSVSPQDIFRLRWKIFFPLFSFHFVTKVDPFVESRNSVESLKSSFVARTRKRDSQRVGKCGLNYRETEAVRLDSLVLCMKCLLLLLLSRFSRVRLDLLPRYTFLELS